MENEQVVDTSSNSLQNDAQATALDSSNYEEFRAARNGKPVEEPVKAAEPEAEVAQDAKTTDESEADEPEGEREKRPSGYKRLKEKVAELEAKLQDRPPAKEPEAKPKAAAADDPDAKPLLADFETTEEWADARDDWKRRQEAKAERQNAHKTRMAEAKKAHGEKFTDAMAELSGIEAKGKAYDELESSDRSADLLFYLGTNAEEAERFHRMTETQQIKYIGRIEATLASAKVPQTESKAPFKVVKAPPAPIRPLSGGKSTVSSGKDWMASESYEEFQAGRKRAAGA